MFILAALYLLDVFSLPYLIWSKGHTRCPVISFRDCQNQVIKYAFTIAFHLLLSCTIIFPCSTDITVPLNALFRLSSIPFLVFPSTSHQKLLFSSLNGPVPFSACVQTTSTHTALLHQPVLLCISSFLTLSIRVAPHILLKHLISITFNIFFVTIILHVSVRYITVGIATPSYNLLFMFIPIALQLNTFNISHIIDPKLDLCFHSSIILLPTCSNFSTNCHRYLA